MRALSLLLCCCVVVCFFLPFLMSPFLKASLPWSLLAKAVVIFSWIPDIVCVLVMCWCWGMIGCVEVSRINGQGRAVTANGWRRTSRWSKIWLWTSEVWKVSTRHQKRRFHEMTKDPSDKREEAFPVCTWTLTLHSHSAPVLANINGLLMQPRERERVCVPFFYPSGKDRFGRDRRNWVRWGGLARMLLLCSQKQTFSNSPLNGTNLDAMHVCLRSLPPPPRIAKGAFLAPNKNVRNNSCHPKQGQSFSLLPFVYPPNKKKDPPVG